VADDSDFHPAAALRRVHPPRRPDHHKSGARSGAGRSLGPLSCSTAARSRWAFGSWYHGRVKLRGVYAPETHRAGGFDTIFVKACASGSKDGHFGGIPCVTVSLRTSASRCTRKRSLRPAEHIENWLPGRPHEKQGRLPLRCGIRGAFHVRIYGAGISRPAGAPRWKPANALFRFPARHGETRCR